MSLTLDSSSLSLAARVVALVSGQPASLSLAQGALQFGGKTGFDALTALGGEQLGGATDAERAQVADWAGILAGEGTPVSVAFLQRLDKHLLASAYLPALAYRPTTVDYAVFAAVTGGALNKTTFDAKALPNLARWVRAVAASIPRTGAAAEAFLKGTPLAEKAVEAALPASAIYAIDIAAALAAESKGRAAAAPAAAVAGGKDAAKGEDKKAKAPATAGDVAVAAAAASSKDAKPAKEKKEKPAAAAAAAALAEVSQVYRVDFRVGKVLSVSAHPSEARLFVLQVDVGADLGGARTVVAGVAEHFTAEQLTNALVVVMVNVKSGDVKGVESFGRIMVATSADGSKKELASPPAGAQVGEQIKFAGVPASSKPDQPLAPKRLHEIMKHLHTNAEKRVQYANDDFQTSAGPVVTATIADGTVA